MAARAPAARRRRRYAQHFLRSNALAGELVREADVSRGELVIEIGAGGGALTAELARRAGQVHAYEIDTRWADALARRLARHPNVVIVEGDALAAPFPSEPFRVLANLPFNRTTDVLRHLLDDPRVPLTRADLLVEWDVAQKRARVAPSTFLGVVWGASYELAAVRRLHASAFAPPPPIDAGLLRVVRRLRPLVAPAEVKAYRGLVGSVFACPRPLRRALRERVGQRRFKQLARAHGFAPDARARDLDAYQWAALYAAVRRIR